MKTEQELKQQTKSQGSCIFKGSHAKDLLSAFNTHMHLTSVQLTQESSNINLNNILQYEMNFMTWKRELYKTWGADVKVVYFGHGTHKSLL